MAWWKERAEGERAWRVPAEQITKNNYNLDIKNPNGKKDLEQLPPGILLRSIIEKEGKILEIVKDIQAILTKDDQ